ncbi:MAG TPA: hypothetical protein VKU00_26405 [Chthonomonadaceae bacterium]|nr:hypothetical protein [Chthonomonadaceae bacterium]
MSYADRSGHPPDFEVHYRFYRPEEGGRSSEQPFQGYRCDWSYEGDDISLTGIYMIWPEFQTEEGLPLPDGTVVPIAGTASMWIVSHNLRVQVHRQRIKEGMRGYFMEGGRRIAEATVSRVIGLHSNTFTP